MGCVILGPCRCQGCGGEVVWLHAGLNHLGWLHAHGELRCPKPGPKPTLVVRKR